MTEERRYGDEEIRAIFGAAAGSSEGAEPAIPAATGLTLPELQQIGHEVGIAPERVAAAARALDGGGAVAPRGTYLGLPVSVGRTVDLPRAPTEREWAILVSLLRETFGARGSVSSVGELHEWRNGNLHASIGPTETGHRLVLHTRKSNAVANAVVGSAALAWGVVMMGLTLFAGSAGPVGLAALLLLVGTALLVSGVFRLPAWAAEREAQMEHVAARARALIGGEAPPED